MGMSIKVQTGLIPEIMDHTDPMWLEDASNLIETENWSQQQKL